MKLHTLRENAFCIDCTMVLFGANKCSEQEFNFLAIFEKHPHFQIIRLTSENLSARLVM